MPTHTNRLVTATSPYLLQHAHNPVDWYPWGEEALERARREAKPIFLSIGYASCHWCHVMEHESFEDPHTAALMNALYVNIKVDREERPDLDDVYMHAVQLFTGGHGGWPMSVFLTPTLEPYFAGTYFPPGPRHGMPSFATVLKLASDAFRDRPGDVARTTAQVVQALQQVGAPADDSEAPNAATLQRAYEVLERLYDPQAGGFGGAPKFPHAMDVAFLLRYGRRRSEPHATAMALHTLRAMAAGGIHDQLGGGFHRYATDAHWLVPHFEKMLYDNALLARAYVEAFQVSGEPLFRRVAEGIFDYVGREMTGPEGQFWSAQDADSDGVEGKYFVWTADEIDAVCGAAAGKIVRAYYGVTATGNFEPGLNILSVPRAAATVAASLGIDEDELERVLHTSRDALLGARQKRVRPALDDKVIAAWNGLMIRALAPASRLFGAPELLSRATAAADFVVAAAGDGLFRAVRGGRVSGPGFLDDWACMIAACLDLYEASFAPRWLETAAAWSERVRDEFGARNGSFHYAGKRHEALLVPARNALDTATPSGHSVHASNLLRLALLTGDARWQTDAERCLRAHGQTLRDSSTAMGEMLCAVDLWLGPTCEVAVTGNGADAETLAAAVFQPFVPAKVVAGWPRQGPPADVALLRGRGLVDGRAAVYVCRNHACLTPLTDPGAVAAALATATGAGAPAG